MLPPQLDHLHPPARADSRRSRDRSQDTAGVTSKSGARSRSTSLQTIEGRKVASPDPQRPPNKPVMKSAEEVERRRREEVYRDALALEYNHSLQRDADAHRRVLLPRPRAPAASSVQQASAVHAPAPPQQPPFVPPGYHFSNRNPRDDDSSDGHTTGSLWHVEEDPTKMNPRSRAGAEREASSSKDRGARPSKRQTTETKLDKAAESERALRQVPARILTAQARLRYTTLCIENPEQAEAIAFYDASPNAEEYREMWKHYQDMHPKQDVPPVDDRPRKAGGIPSRGIKQSTRQPRDPVVHQMNSGSTDDARVATGEEFDEE